MYFTYQGRNNAAGIEIPIKKRREESITSIRKIDLVKSMRMWFEVAFMFTFNASQLRKLAWQKEK